MLYKKTYIKAIENSIGSRIFNSLFVEESGKSRDVMNDGEFSCAFFVSSLLALFESIDKPCATVATLRGKLKAGKGWQEVGEDGVEPGDVVFWQKVRFEDGSENAHVGFAINGKEAVSTDYKKRQIGKNPLHFRQIEAAYRYTWPN